MRRGASLLFPGAVPRCCTGVKDTAVAARYTSHAHCFCVIFHTGTTVIVIHPSPSLNPRHPQMGRGQPNPCQRQGRRGGGGPAAGHAGPGAEPLAGQAEPLAPCGRRRGEAGTHARTTYYILHALCPSFIFLSFSSKPQGHILPSDVCRSFAKAKPTPAANKQKQLQQTLPTLGTHSTQACCAAHCQGRFLSLRSCPATHSH